LKLLLPRVALRGSMCLSLALGMAPHGLFGKFELAL